MSSKNGGYHPKGYKHPGLQVDRWGLYGADFTPSPPPSRSQTKAVPLVHHVSDVLCEGSYDSDDVTFVRSGRVLEKIVVCRVCKREVSLPEKS